jgi:pimeloyl-ACP methyl ester carboxylesterase
MRKLWICLMVMGVGSMALGDAHWADSDIFSLNLLSPFPSISVRTAVADSSVFSLNLYSLDRAWADSAAFDFKWFANTNPISAPVVRPDWPQDSPRLLELDAAGNWQPTTVLPPKGTTIIIVNHGWNDSPFANTIADDDIQDLAIRIAAAAPNAKIYSWWWGNGPDTVSESNPNGKPGPVDFANLLKYIQSPNPLDPTALVTKCILGDKSFHGEINGAWSNSQKHGERLGKLMAAIGLVPRDYPMHMIGHSFGGVVSAKAANYLYKNSYGKVKQLTTIETPALPWPYAIQAVEPDSADRVEVLYYQWLPDILSIGFGGPKLSFADNLFNYHLMPCFYPGVLHTNSVEWYIDSINSTAACDPAYYGFNWSFASPNQPAVLPTGIKAEDFNNRGCVVDILPVTVVKTVAKAVNKSIDVLDSLASWTGDKVVAAGEWIKGNYTSYATITTSITLAPSDPNMPIPPDGDDHSAGIGKRFLVPAEADTLSLDVRFRQVSPGDWLTIAFDDKIVLMIDAATEGVSSEFKIYSTAISEYAGKEVLLRVTLESNTSQATIADLNNLRFTEDTITADINEDGVVDVLDLIAMSEYWMGPVYSPDDPSAKADINGDKKIDLLDLAELSDSWLWKKTADPSQP